LIYDRHVFFGRDATMKRYGIFVGLACIFGGIITVFGAGASVELEPKAIEAKIREHRMGNLVVKAKPGAEVHVKQLRHEFWFGAALSSGVFSGRMNAEDQRKYKERHEIPLRGHNIFWGIPNRVQTWLKAMDDATLHETLKARALDIGHRYRGRFAEYDLNNEMIHANYYEERFGAAITKQMADWVKKADPGAKLFFNDYDILTGNRLDDYTKHIRGLLEQGTPMAGIGVQGHLHGETFDPVALNNALDELAKIGLPICITEFNMPGQRSVFMKEQNLKLTEQNLKLTPAQEQAKAKAITDYYRICFAHPAVEGILMWGFWEGANWIWQSSLYRRDWTPTPAAEAYHDLIFKEWWINSKVKADANGQCRVRAFYGKYAVTCGAQTKEVLLNKEKGQATVSFE